MTERPWRSFVWWVVVYATAMGLLEAAVVIYLRALYFPEGFRFPLVAIDRNIAIVEVAREAATMLMLLAPAAWTTRNASARLAWFCLAFGVWDISYYVWLKVFLDWPSSLLDPDILFLIPVPWVGPVLVPCLISLGLIAFALMVLSAQGQRPSFRLQWNEGLLLATGAAFMIASTMIDYLRELAAKDQLAHAWSIGERSDLFQFATGYMPDRYPWWCFVTGLALAALGLLRIQVRRSH